MLKLSHKGGKRGLNTPANPFRECKIPNKYVITGLLGIRSEATWVGMQYSSDKHFQLGIGERGKKI